MTHEIKNIAIIGANKEGLKLLPVLLADKSCRVRLIADPNKDAMLFKLNELGYRLARKYDIKATNDPHDIKKIPDLDIIINALQDQATDKFLRDPDFRDIEKLGPLSTRLVWGVKASAESAGRGQGQFAALGEQTALLSALREIVDAVRLTIDRKELLSVVLKLATESSRAERGSIMLLNREEGTLRVEIAKGMDEEVVRKIRVPLGSGVSGKAAKDGKAILISGKASPDEFARPMERSDVKSAMCVPLIVEGEVIGVVNVSSSESSHAFTNDDLNFLTSLASLAAEVIQRSNEYERLRVDSAKFAFWKEVDSIMSSQMQLDKRLNIVARKLVDVIPGLTSFIYIYDEDTDRLYLKAASIKDSKGLGIMGIRPGEGIEGSALDAPNDLVLVDRTQEGAIKRIYLSLPMTCQGSIVGTFNGQIISPQGLSVYHESFLRDIRTLLAESVYKHKQAEKEKLKTRRMFAVDESGLEMLSMTDAPKLAAIIATTPAAVIGAEGSIFRLKQAGTQRFQTMAQYGLDDKNIREYFLPIEKETVMEVLRRKEPVLREFSEDASPYIRSVLSYPLRIKDAVAGVITFFNKSGAETIYPCAFSKSDADIVGRFAVYAEKAISGGPGAPRREPEAPAAEDRNTPAIALFSSRIEDELNRARRHDRGFMLATVRIAGLKAPFLKHKEEFESRFIAVVRKRTRSFDVVVKLNEETYGFLFLDTHGNLARFLDALSEAVTTDPEFNKSVAEGRLDVLYGAAAFPKDGDSFVELFSKASKRVRLSLNKSFEPEL